MKTVYVYYSEWDGKTGSHDLLRQAAWQHMEDLKGDFCRPMEKEERISRHFHRAGEQAERIPAFPAFADAEDFFSVIKDKEDGKPYFKEMRELHFSISHSGKIWSCAFGEREVGLDLQEMHGRNCEKIARRFFHPAEIRWLEENGFDQFCRLWAYKESFVKYTGEGLARGLDYFSVAPEGASEEEGRGNFWGSGKEKNSFPEGGIFPGEGKEKDPKPKERGLMGRDRKDAGLERKTLLQKEGEQALQPGNGRLAGGQKDWIRRSGLGAAGVCQQEIPFREGFWMVVTSADPVRAVLRELERKGS